MLWRPIFQREWLAAKEANRLLERLRDSGQYCHEIEIALSDEVTEQAVCEWVRETASWEAKVVRCENRMHVFLLHDNDATMLQLAFGDAKHGHID